MENKEQEVPRSANNVEAKHSSSPTFCQSLSFWCFYYCPPFVFHSIFTYLLSFWEGLTQFIGLNWRSIIMVITPFALLPIIIVHDTQEHRCLYVVCFMTIYWTCEALPLPVSSMLPIVLFPLLGILSTRETCMMYMSEGNMDFIGGLVIVSAVQYSNLHKRVALKVISVIGCSQRKLNFGLIAVTTFLSMWVSNAATISTMVPIIKAILDELEGEGLFKLYEDEDPHEDENTQYFDHVDKKPAKITVCYFMGAAYVTSIGGCASIQGTPSNLALKLIYEAKFNNQYLDFIKWMYFNIPLVVLNMFATWAYLQWYFMGLFRPHSKEAKQYRLGKEGEKVVRKVISRRYKELGPVSQREIQVGILFVTSIFLNFFRAPGFVRGWADLMPKVLIEESTASMLIVVILFMLPGHWDRRIFTRNKQMRGAKSKTFGLITWKYVNKHLNWSLLFLIGGGFAVARGGQVSGMSHMLGAHLSSLSGLPFLLLLFLVCLLIQIITEFVSSVALANVVLPVLAELAITIKVHPLYLMYAATLSCSMGFHTLFGTPQNMIAAEVANIRPRDITMAGFGPSFVSLITIWLVFPTWGILVYPELNTFPDWAKPTNATI